MSYTSGLLPVQSSPEYEPDPARFCLKNADQIFDALASESARRILSVLAEDPKPTSAVAEAIGTSTQNASYHINTLHSAGLLTVVDTWYSEKGSEMDVYAPKYDPFVLTLGESTDKTILSDEIEATNVLERPTADDGTPVDEYSL